MDRKRYLECLAADERRLRELAGGADLATPVPSCPDWTLADLVEHVALVYLHKVESMRHGRPRRWPPADVEPEPLVLLDRGYRELAAEFAARPDDEASPTWYEPDQTVGFWVRRMAQETVVHRIDAELAVGAPIVEVPADLALDGVDEILLAFLGYAARSQPGSFADRLPAAEHRVLVTGGGRGWLVGLGPAGIAVTRADTGTGTGTGRVGADGAGTGSDGAGTNVDRAGTGADLPEVDPAAAAAGTGGTVEPDAVVSARPDDLLRWLWRRSPDEAVRITGDAAAVRRFRRVLEVVTR
ncbi:maleylpyruvate isomerase N-terminal domain-containing protein [Plantactinospora sp. KBS50]|uniref:maleylpyruvate isomerase N-terminal domain-containing protein n=1 Tax=Plantactinospora sp. KBS50 TaxID=2024580 RepID=UPI000BAAE074|nr:maleylpyruvate isomerase N-terminal domain-containing protein [Plantactinospora sp. KBS50]ASW53329.1 hypothetical protein CIK06_02720 [Plantactinospora sp. KBS50]